MQSTKQWEGECSLCRSLGSLRHPRLDLAMAHTRRYRRAEHKQPHFKDGNTNEKEEGSWVGECARQGGYGQKECARVEKAREGVSTPQVACDTESEGGSGQA
jgi:hypothetical protein